MVQNSRTVVEQGWRVVSTSDLPFGGEELRGRVANYTGAGTVTPGLLTARFGFDPGLAQRLLNELVCVGVMERCTDGEADSFRRAGSLRPAAIAAPQPSPPDSSHVEQAAVDDDEPLRYEGERSTRTEAEADAESLRLVLVAAARFAPLTLGRVTQISGGETDTVIDLIGGLVEDGKLVPQNSDFGFEWVAV